MQYDQFLCQRNSAQERLSWFLVCRVCRRRRRQLERKGPFHADTAGVQISFYVKKNE